MKCADIVLVTPALKAANNGNWQTAQRWARFLSGDYRVRVTGDWHRGQEQGESLMIALHARRSAAAISAWRAAFPQRPLVVVLTGTDLYRDIADDADAQNSLRLADRLVVLNELGVDELPPELLAKTVVCLQSSPSRRTVAKTTQRLRVLMVGHLREEKSPQTYFDAARLLAHRDDISLDHIGAALAPSFAEQARALMQTCPRYRWLGAMPHDSTRRRIQAAHVLVHCSRIEGGAEVLIEAITSGTPVIVSRIAGNLGLLGADYAGCFDWGDAAALAGLLQRSRDDPAMLAALQAQCAQRAALFDPAHERQTLRTLVFSLLSMLARTPHAA